MQWKKIDENSIFTVEFLLKLGADPNDYSNRNELIQNNGKVTPNIGEMSIPTEIIKMEIYNSTSNKIKIFVISGDFGSIISRNFNDF